jgi:hypothetical protein
MPTKGRAAPRTKFATLYLKVVAGCEGPETLGQNENGCWPWAGRLDRYNYGTINIYSSDLGKTLKRRPHRILVESFLGRKLHEDEETIEHAKDCVRRCANLDHLSLLSRSDNTKRARGGTVAHRPLPDPVEDWEAVYVRTYSPEEPCPF